MKNTFKDPADEMYQEFLQYKHDTMCGVFTYRGMCANFIELGYRKIPKLGVMLTQEQYDKLKNKADSVTELQNNIDHYKAEIEDLEFELGYSERFAKRLTAEKLLIDILDFLHNETFHKGYELKKVEKKVYELAKQHDVKIGEDDEESIKEQ